MSSSFLYVYDALYEIICQTQSFQRTLNVVLLHAYHISVTLFLVPLHTIVKLDTRSSKAIQGTSDGKINLSIAQTLYTLKVVQVSTTASICDGNRAPL